MRLIILFAVMLFASGLKAQTFVPGSFLNNASNSAFASPFTVNNSLSQKKWLLSKYGAVSTSFLSFKGGSATMVSAPLGLQLNRRINDNVSAFAGVSVAPTYINFNRSFTSGNLKGSQPNSFLQQGNFGMFSKAELGLQYTNDEKTFSISGSISVGSSSYPMLPYYQMNNISPAPVTTTNR